MSISVLCSYNRGLSAALSLAPADLPTVAPDGVTCVALDLSVRAESWFELAISRVTVAEQARAERFLRRRDAIRHVVGRALARSLLGEAAGAPTTDFPLNPFGKPIGPTEFNISHSGDAIWIALCPVAAVGVDVEEADRVSDPLAIAEIFHPAERAELEALSGERQRRAFCRCWSRKEAVVKAMGDGLSRPLATFRVFTGEEPCHWLSEAPPSAGGWTTVDLPAVAGCSGSVAAMAEGLRVHCHILA